MKYGLEIGTIYNFSMLAPTILGIKYENAKLVGILDFSSAMMVEDVSTLHSNIYNTLPSNTPRDAKDLIYLKIKTSTGEFRVFAIDWLNGEPTVVESKTVQVTIDNVDLSQISILRAALVKNGFEQFTINTM